MGRYEELHSNKPQPKNNSRGSSSGGGGSSSQTQPTSKIVSYGGRQFKVTSSGETYLIRNGQQLKVNSISAASPTVLAQKAREQAKRQTVQVQIGSRQQQLEAESNRAAIQESLFKRQEALRQAKAKADSDKITQEDILTGRVIPSLGIKPKAPKGFLAKSKAGFNLVLENRRKEAIDVLKNIQSKQRQGKKLTPSEFAALGAAGLQKVGTDVFDGATQIYREPIKTVTDTISGVKQLFTSPVETTKAIAFEIQKDPAGFVANLLGFQAGVGAAGLALKPLTKVVGNGAKAAVVTTAKTGAGVVKATIRPLRNGLKTTVKLTNKSGKVVKTRNIFTRFKQARQAAKVARQTQQNLAREIIRKLQNSKKALKQFKAQKADVLKSFKGKGVTTSTRNIDKAIKGAQKSIKELNQKLKGVNVSAATKAKIMRGLRAKPKPKKAPKVKKPSKTKAAIEKAKRELRILKAKGRRTKVSISVKPEVSTAVYKTLKPVRTNIRILNRRLSKVGYKIKATTIKGAKVTSKTINKVIQRINNNLTIIANNIIKNAGKITKSINREIKKLIKDAKIIGLRIRITAIKVSNKLTRKVRTTKTALKKGIKRTYQKIDKTALKPVRTNIRILNRRLSKVGYKIKATTIKVKTKLTKSGKIIISYGKDVTTRFTKTNIARVNRLLKKTIRLLKKTKGAITKEIRRTIRQINTISPIKIKIVKQVRKKVRATKVTGQQLPKAPSISKLRDFGVKKVVRLIRQKKISLESIPKGKFKTAVRKSLRKKAAKQAVLRSDAIKNPINRKSKLFNQKLRQKKVNALAAFVYDKLVPIEKIPKNLLKDVKARVKLLNKRGRVLRVSRPRKSRRKSRTTKAKPKPVSKGNEIDDGRGLVQLIKNPTNVKDFKIKGVILISNKEMKAIKKAIKSHFKKLKAKAAAAAKSKGKIKVKRVAAANNEINNFGTILKAAGRGAPNIRFIITPAIAATLELGKQLRKKANSGRYAVRVTGIPKQTPKLNIQSKLKVQSKLKEIVDQKTPTKEKVIEVTDQKLNQKTTPKQVSIIRNILLSAGLAGLVTKLMRQTGKPPYKGKQSQLSGLRLWKSALWSYIRSKKFNFTPDLVSLIFGLRATKAEARALTRAGRIFTGLETRRIVK